MHPPCTHSHVTHISVLRKTTRFEKMQCAPGCREPNAQYSFKWLCSGVTTGSRKVTLLHPALPPRIDPPVISWAPVYTDSCPCNAAASISTHPQNSAGAVIGHGNAVNLSSLPSLSFPYDQTDSWVITFPNWPFLIELPSFNSWASWGLVLVVHGNKTPSTRPPFTLVLTPGITISFHSRSEMERWS